MAGGQLGDERIGQPRERVVDRVADVTVIDVAAVRRGHELDDLACVERPVDRVERSRPWRAPLRDRLGDLAQGVAHGVDPVEIPGRGLRLGRHLGLRPVGAFAMDDAAIDEPGQGVVEAGELLHRETIVRVGGVQEVEGRVQVHAMRVTLAGVEGGICQHCDNHCIPIDRLRARG